MDIDRIISKLEKKQATVGVIGLGYVGLPLAVRLSLRRELRRTLTTKPSALLKRDSVKSEVGSQRESDLRGQKSDVSKSES